MDLDSSVDNSVSKSGAGVSTKTEGESRAASKEIRYVGTAVTQSGRSQTRTCWFGAQM